MLPSLGPLDLPRQRDNSMAIPSATQRLFMPAYFVPPVYCDIAPSVHFCPLTPTFGYAALFLCNFWDRTRVPANPSTFNPHHQFIYSRFVRRRHHGTGRTLRVTTFCLRTCPHTADTATATPCPYTVYHTHHKTSPPTDDQSPGVLPTACSLIPVSSFFPVIIIM